MPPDQHPSAFAIEQQQPYGVTVLALGRERGRGLSEVRATRQLRSALEFVRLRRQSSCTRTSGR